MIDAARIIGKVPRHWPETGFEEINRDVFQSDFRPKITSEYPVIRPNDPLEDFFLRRAEGFGSFSSFAC